MAAGPLAGAETPPTGAYGAADPMFREPYIDIDDWRDAPVRHHYMHGGFKGTDLKFSFYFPEKAQYQGRFFQHVAPAPGREDLALQGAGENNVIAFAFASGGYLVESNMGGQTPPQDAAVTGFRASAAAADYSRVVATKLFGGKRPYGYIYGGSGGGFRTMAAIENTTVWDGAVPYVIGSPRAMSVISAGRARVARVLKDKLPQILDAIDAGGSGDMYAGLNKDEQDALREMIRFGIPLQTLYVGLGSLSVGSSAGVAGDPTYVSDFWTKPGYEGSDPNSYAARARVQFKTRVAKLLTADEATKLGVQLRQTRGGFVNPVGADFASRPGGAATAAAPTPGPVAIQLDSVPAKNLAGAVLLVKSGAAAGKSLPLGQVAGSVVTLGNGGGGGFGFNADQFGGRGGGGGNNSAQVLALLKPGDEVELDNSASLAGEVYQRYQIPEGDYMIWDQYRDKNGKPLYPQRPPISGPFSGDSSIAGTVQNGVFKAKVIVAASLWDELATPWNADWYTRKVKAHLGSKFSDNYRIWYTDHAMHSDSTLAQAPTRIVTYTGVLYQALRDVADWVEKGVPPPASTNYRMVDSQVVVPATAAERRGIQPVVTLKANGRPRADVAVGQTVTFSGVVDVPPNTGKIVLAEWDFDGAGAFPVKSQLTHVSATRATVTATYTFSKPGAYFPVLRATSQRLGDAQTPWGRIRNLGRVRVVVK